VLAALLLVADQSLVFPVGVVCSPSSSSSAETILKKLVGESCLSSPTMTICRPRARTPSASSGGTWLASSITTRLLGIWVPNISVQLPSACAKLKQSC